MMKLYICGPITGMPNDNRDSFLAAAVDLSLCGYESVNPHDIGDELARTMRSRAPTWQEYMKADIPWLLKCDGVALLDGWSWSKGASIEYKLARELGIEAAPLAYWLSGEKQ